MRPDIHEMIEHAEYLFTPEHSAEVFRTALPYPPSGRSLALAKGLKFALVMCASLVLFAAAASLT